MTYEEAHGPPHRRFSGRRPACFTAVAMAVVQLAGTSAAGRHQSDRVQLDVLAYLLLLAGPALLLFRRRMPVVVAAGTGAVTLLYVALGYPWGPVFASLVVAFFSAVAAGRRRAVFVVAAAVFCGHALIGLWLYRWLPPSSDHGMTWTQVSGAAAWLLAVLAAAELFRVRREQLARDRRERAEAERRQVDGERMRIARELHDVLAHSISVINVQAGVALALMDDRPEQARTALTTIKAASKEALGEVRQVLSTLRAPGEAPRSPAPGLDRLPELVEQATSAGLTADVQVEGNRVPLPPGVDLAVFRIIQEALTNIVRHSGSRTARVRLSYLPGSVEVRVDDEGPAVAGGESGGGNGLVGMRERAAALGGSVEAGPRPDGGFRVRATLPRTASDAPLTTGPPPATGPLPATDPPPATGSFDPSPTANPPRAAGVSSTADRPPAPGAPPVPDESRSTEPPSAPDHARAHDGHLTPAAEERP